MTTSTRAPDQARMATGQPLTFDTKTDADDWLSLRRSEILRDDWLPPAAHKAVPVTVREFAERGSGIATLRTEPANTEPLPTWLARPVGMCPGPAQRLDGSRSPQVVGLSLRRHRSYPAVP